MSISLRTCIVLGGEVNHGDFTFEGSGLTTIGALLEQADRQGLPDEGFFEALVSAGPDLDWITVLHNGSRIDLSEDLSRPLADGDEVSVLTPLVGG